MNSQPLATETNWGLRGTAGATIAGHLTFNAVHFNVDGRAILDHISFSVQPGEIISLLGPSGCGKTTLLRLAAGGAWPSHGEILLDGQVIAGLSKQVPPEKRNIGLVFQDFVLFPHLTVAQNVGFGLKGWSKLEAENAVHSALARVGMADRKAAYPHHLSGGEQQRIALARAVAPRPQVLLMDEPFSGLDQALRRHIRDETLALLREMRASVIMVTHDPVEAMEVSDRIMLMNQGKIIQIGSPSEIYNKPNSPWAAQFVGECNFFACEVQGNKVSTPFGLMPYSTSATSVNMLVRPENFKQHKGGLEGLVRESQFLGQTCRLKVALAGLEKEVVMSMPAASAPKRGTVAEFGLIQLNQVFMFEN